MDIIEVLKIILFGIIEGITEWLPVSSTGHMIILEQILDVKTIFDGGEEFWEFFLVAIQLGAIIAVICCFFNKLNPFWGKSLINEGEKKSKEEKKNIWLLWAKVLVACLPAAVIGLLLDDWLDAHLYNSITVSITLIIYGILFIIMEWWNKKREFKIKDCGELTFKMAFIIGMIQLLALIPGTSRSGVTILGAMLILCSRDVAAEFSFFLSIPVMLGASLLKGVKYIIRAGAFSANDVMLLLIGCAVAFIVSILVIKLLMKFIKKHDFTSFGVYRIILGVILIILFLTHAIAL